MTNYTGMVQLSSTDPQAGLPPDYSFTQADQGVQSFLVMLKTAGILAIFATDAALGMTGEQDNIQVNGAPAAAFVVGGYQSSVNAGTLNHFTDRVVDAYGNTATGYTGTVHFSSDDPSALLPQDYTFTTADAGVHTFEAMFMTPGTHYLRAVDTVMAMLAGEQDGIVVA